MNTLSPYLVFNGNAREALDFYAEVFGGSPRVNTYSEFGITDMPAENLMHGQLTVTDGWTIMAADSTRPGDEVVRGGSTLCIWGEDVEGARAQFDRLAEGGTVNQPLEMQPWGDMYGDLTDRFGITWGFNVHPARQA